MLITLRQQLHRSLRQRRGRLLLTLFAALWLALPLSAATSTNGHLSATLAQQETSHCSHHAQADERHHDAHHGSDHHCHCAQACHASPGALSTNTLGLPPAAATAETVEPSPTLVTAIHTPLYRPPIALAA